jgi:butyrate kinase
MAKQDYTNSSVINKYKTLVVKPGVTPSKITVADSEKRTRAELLDMVEELFQTKVETASDYLPNFEKIRALLHILIKSVNNSEDDGSGGISQAQADAIVANTAKVSQGLVTANHSMQFDVINNKGNYILRITVTIPGGKTPITKTADIALS